MDSLAIQIIVKLAAWVEQIDGNEVRVNPPATPEAIKALEAAIGRALPADLKDFYEDADGVSDSWYCFSIMSAAEVAEYVANLARIDSAPYYMSRADHLAFSHVDGSYYFYAMTPTGYRGIYLWDHETDDRTWVCRDLAAWAEKALDGL